MDPLPIMLSHALSRKVLLLPSQPEALGSTKSWQNKAVDLIN